jgi:hypothetical protein
LSQSSVRDHSSLVSGEVMSIGGSVIGTGIGRRGVRCRLRSLEREKEIAYSAERRKCVPRCRITHSRVGRTGIKWHLYDLRATSSSVG